MKRIVLVAALVLPVSALAQSQFHVPDHLPVPGPHGSHNPTPHPRPIPVHYYLDCTMVPNTLLGGYIFHVHNYGHNTVPAGMPIEATSGFVRVNANLTHALGATRRRISGRRRMSSAIR